jgi:hypothetical protein
VPKKLPLVANMSMLGCALKSVIRSRVGSVPVPVNAARPIGSVIGPPDGRLIAIIVPGVEIVWGTKASMKATCAAIPSDGVGDVLVQLADPVRDMEKEVSVPFAGLNCATDVPAKALLLVDIVAAGSIVIVKFSVMVSALAAGAALTVMARAHEATANAALIFDFMAVTPS